MAASSPVVEGYHSHSHFVEGYLSHFVDLQHVNRRLQWNPFYEDRLSTRFDWQHAKEPLFESARKIVEYYAEPLTKYEEGRTIMDAEDPGEYAPDPHYWRERANFYKATYERLQKEPIYSESRSPTPDVFRPWMFDETELGQAKGHATHAAGLLATVPGGTALLEAEDHGDSATDPEYWRGKKKYYEAKFTALYQTTTLERAKLYVDAVARRLATFAAGKALLEAEDHGDHATDPEYWRSKRDYYRDEYSRLRKDFWKCWKSRYLEGGVSYFQPTFDPEPKPRARQISVVTESSSTRITGSSTQREKGTDRLSLKTIMSSSNSARWSKKEKDARSVERRKRKDKYRRQKGYEMEPKPPSPPLSCSAIQSPPNGFGTPKSNESQAQRQVIGRRCRDSIQKQQQTHEVANQSPRGGQKRSHMQLPNPYITPSSPDHSVVTAQQRRKRKNTVRQRRHQISTDVDSSPFEPISSRLRSSGCKGRI